MPDEPIDAIPADSVDRNTFQFTGGRLVPVASPFGTAEGDMDELCRRIGYYLDSTFNDDETHLYAAAASRGPRWILNLGDASSIATVLIVGWIDYFDAMRYFQPVIAVRDAYGH